MFTLVNIKKNTIIAKKQEISQMVEENIWIFFIWNNKTYLIYIFHEYVFICFICWNSIRKKRILVVLPCAGQCTFYLSWSIVVRTGFQSHTFCWEDNFTAYKQNSIQFQNTYELYQFQSMEQSLLVFLVLIEKKSLNCNSWNQSH